MRVLIVEDDRAVAGVLQYLILKEQAAAEIAGSCREAREVLIQADPFDLVILDLRLPDGDGLSLAEAIHRRDRLTDIVVLTGQGSLEDASRAIRSGVTDFLTKPVMTPEFHEVIARAQMRTALRKGPEEQRVERVITMMGDMTDRLDRVERELRELRTRHA